MKILKQATWLKASVSKLPAEFSGKLVTHTALEPMNPCWRKITGQFPSSLLSANRMIFSGFWSRIWFSSLVSCNSGNLYSQIKGSWSKESSTVMFYIPFCPLGIPCSSKIYPTKSYNVVGFHGIPIVFHNFPQQPMSFCKPCGKIIQKKKVYDAHSLFAFIKEYWQLTMLFGNYEQLLSCGGWNSNE